MNEFSLTNAELWIGDGTRFHGFLVVRDGAITDLGHGPYNGPLPSIDLEGMALSPGMVDLMVLGGFDLSIYRNDPLEIARRYVELGVTACQFCTGTLPMDTMEKIAANLRTAMAYTGLDTARVLGLYLEGPFQYPGLTGASLTEYAIPPTPANVTRILEIAGDVLNMINVSPGTENDAQAVKRFTAEGKVVSMAHANAPAERVWECVDAGTSILGHVWNNHQGALAEPGVQQATIDQVGLTDERVRFVHMICDGTHVHPVNMNLVARCRGVEGLCLVTDAVPRAGCPDGPFTWDDGRHFVKKGGVGRTDNGGLCGSALLLPDHFRSFVKVTGTPPHKAIRTVTLNPAASIGQDDRLGSLLPGHRADLVAWDRSLQVRRIWREGIELDSVSDLCDVRL